MVTKLSWVVEGSHTMHCSGCAQTVEFSLRQIEGVHLVKADYKAQQIEAEVDMPELRHRIVAEMGNLGYQVLETSHDDLSGQ